MLTICPTADYEIYFGQNILAANEVLFEPTRKLLALWQEAGVSATLFPDVCSVWRHREMGMSEYVDEFESQIQNAANGGHDIQLHIHPEWGAAERVNGSWRFQEGTHALHDLGFSEGQDGAGELLTKGKQYLEGLLKPHSPAYRCRVFRAGGWIIQPEKALFQALLDRGIDTDATVIPGVCLPRGDYRIDFRDVPCSGNWFIDPDVGISQDSGNASDMFEVPIASYRGRGAFWVHVANQLRLRYRMKRNRQPTRGFPITKKGRKRTLAKRIRDKVKILSLPRILDMADTHESMITIVESYLKKQSYLQTDVALCMNGHPKDTYDFHLTELRKFFEIMRHRYSGEVTFATISEFVAARRQAAAHEG